MTNAEKQEIIEAVLAALATNSKTIAQLSPKQSLIDSDLFEVAGGSRVTYLVLKNGIREGLALASQLSDYVTGEQAMIYLAKLDTETGTIDYMESPCVMLDGFKDVNGYSPATGDLFYENRSGYQIWTKTQGGATGEHANTHVAYINRNENAIYRWTGTTMERIGGCAVVNDLTTGGGDKALSAEMGPLLKSNINTVQANIVKLYNKLANMAFWDAEDQAAAEPQPLDWQVPKKTLTIANNIEHAVVKYNGVQVSSVQVDAGETISLLVQGSTGWAVSSVTVSGATVIDNGDGTFTVRVKVNNDMTLTISGTVVVVVDITYNLTNCTKASGPTSVQEGGTATIELQADATCSMPLTLPSGAVTGADVASYTPSQDGSSATLVIENVTGDVSITIAAVGVDLHKGIFVVVASNKYYIQNNNNSSLKRACLLCDRENLQNPCTWGGTMSGEYVAQDMLDYSTIPIPANMTKVSMQCNSNYYYGLTLVNASGVAQNTAEWTIGSTKKELNFADYPNATHICVNFKIGSAGTSVFSSETYESMEIDFKIA